MCLHVHNIRSALSSRFCSKHGSHKSTKSSLHVPSSSSSSSLFSSLSSSSCADTDANAGASTASDAGSGASSSNATGGDDVIDADFTETK